MVSSAGTLWKAFQEAPGRKSVFTRRRLASSASERTKDSGSGPNALFPEKH